MNTVDTLKRLYKDYTKNYIKKIAFAMALSAVIASSTSAIAYLLDPAIKKIFIEQDTKLIIIIPICIILAFALKGASLYFARLIMIGVAQDVTKDVQSDMIKSLIKADTQLIDNKHTGEFVSNLTNDVSMITTLISTVMLNMFKDTLTLVGLLSVMFYQNWKLALVAIIMIPVAGVAAKSLGKRIGKVSTQSMEKAGTLNSYLIELFKNHRLIKIFQREEYENQRANTHLDELKEMGKKIMSVFIRATPVMETMTGIMIALLIFISGKLIFAGEIDINNFFSFLAAMMLAYQPVRSLATLNITIGQGISASRRILPIIDDKNYISEEINAKNLKLSKGDIKFININFKYVNKEEEILKSIDLNINGGKMTSLVGHSGAGKTTILNLIPRFYDPISGDITVDNQSIYKSTINSLRKNISLVSQDTTLFDDTIKNNIIYANSEATEDEVRVAAKLSFAEEFINKLPDKYETIIGENGLRLSGGEKQRLSIARAMIKKSPIILLDEATSSLDAETESKIQEALSILTENRTTLVIAHRLSTILKSDKIYVIDNGLVVGEGNHKDLVKNSEIYKNFYQKQIRKD
jgi:subfamily B ATP-binding cassette protein MsbA